jgi:hypothetical protein
MPLKTSVKLADDVVAGVRQLRNEQALSLSDAVNVLARRGLESKDRPAPDYQPMTFHMGTPRLDLTNTAEALAILEGDDYK